MRPSPYYSLGRGRTNFDQLVPQVAGRLAGASFARKNGRGSSHGSVQWGLGHRDRPCTAAPASTRAPALAPFSTGARIAPAAAGEAPGALLQGACKEPVASRRPLIERQESGDRQPGGSQPRRMHPARKEPARSPAGGRHWRMVEIGAAPSYFLPVEPHAIDEIEGHPRQVLHHVADNIMRCSGVLGDWADWLHQDWLP